jgi:hypothetical protein
MDSVSWSDFEFYEHGEDGNPPKELVLNFIAGKFYPYTVKPALVTTSINLIDVITKVRFDYSKKTH